LRAFIRPNNKGVSPARTEGFTPQEIDRLRVATRSTSFPNMLRLVGNMLGGGGGVATTGLAGAGYLSGDPRFYAAAGLGLGARRMSNVMMRNRAGELSRMTAARSPLAQQMGVGGPGGPLLDLAPAQAGLLSMAAQQGTPASLPQFAGAQMPFRRISKTAGMNSAALTPRRPACAAKGGDNAKPCLAMPWRASPCRAVPRLAATKGG
jgi:hypothetical protein